MSLRPIALWTWSSLGAVRKGSLLCGNFSPETGKSEQLRLCEWRAGLSPV